MIPHHTTQIDLAGIVIRDPVTAATNVLIFATGWWCWRRVKASSVPHVRSWGWFFLALGVSSLVAMFVHGFSAYMNERTLFWVWILMGTTQDIGVSSAQLATAQQHFPRQLPWIRILVALQLVVTTACFIYFESYEAAKAHIALGLLPVMGWNFYLASKGNKPALWIATGILVSGLTAAVHSFKLSLGLYFNYNDIAHVLIIISILMICNGVRKMC